MADIYIHWGSSKDLARCVEIADGLGYYLTKKQLRESLNTRGVTLLCASIGDELVGYCVYQLCPDGIAIWQLRVDCRYHGQGVGRAMVSKLKGRLKDQRTHIAVSLAVENGTGEAFLRACKFKTARFLRGEEPGEVDRLLMEFRLPKQGSAALS